jgi:glycosyltransferase involved in cell wall biosynthesis
MKIAIVCDWLVTTGGAEKLLAEVLNCYPDADLFAVVDFLPTEERKFLLEKKPKTTFIQHLPFAKSKYRQYIPLMPFAIEQLDLSSYDLIISSSHAVAKGVITGPDQVHISYVHTPMRYAWDLQHQYLKETGLDKHPLGFIARYFLHKLRMWDVKTGNGVDHFIANSNYIARRIQKIYRRNAHVIYPPIDTAQFKPSSTKENFYLTASRFVPYKKIDIIVESFKHMKDQKLIVIGDGPDFKKIQNKAPKNVEMLGHQPTEVLIKKMQSAKAFIFAAHEDFGIVPLEAQASGTPVIAYGKGGALETVVGLSRPHPTGVFFNEQTPEAIIAAIKTFTAHETQFASENCVANAKLFSKELFREKFVKFVNEKIESV